MTTLGLDLMNDWRDYYRSAQLDLVRGVAVVESTTRRRDALSLEGREGR